MNNKMKPLFPATMDRLRAASFPSRKKDIREVEKDEKNILTLELQEEKQHNSVATNRICRDEVESKVIQPQIALLGGTQTAANFGH